VTLNATLEDQMPSRTSTRAPLLLAAAALLAAGAAADGGAARSRAATIPTITVAGRGTSMTITGPTRWRAGATRIDAVSHGGEQEFTLLHFHPGYGYARFLTDGAHANGHTPDAATAMHRLFANTDFLGGANVFPGTPASFTARLAPGTYYLGEMTARPDFRRITVTRTSAPATPSPNTVVTAYDFGFRSNHTSLPAKGTITIRNTGNQIHRLLLVPVKTGTSRTELGAYLRKTGGAADGPPPPFARKGPQLGTSMISPGQQIELTYTLTPGDYALLSFQPDSRTGKPQTLEGMYATTTLR
jgi:hypothetical protein